ncbi:MAG: RIP metalloprotease RseP [Alphaproteobacteria bacterium]|nr:RIP metalloprotease RseP [Alphaproteobacteria bacterium]
MDFIVNIIYYVVPFLFLLGVLVFVHEFGHYIIAKITGVKVAEFSIGFGKMLWGKTDSSGTLWKVSAVPLGGYCKFLGDTDAASSGNDSSELSEEDKKYAFAFQNPFKKLAIVIGGPAFNYLFAVVVFACIFTTFGKMEFPPVIGSVIENSPAAKAGIKAKDKIVSVDGRKVKSFNEFRQEIEMSTSGEVKLVLMRGKKELKLNVKLAPVVVGENKEQSKKPMLGVTSVTEIEFSPTKMTFFEAVKEAFVECYNISAVTLRGVGQMITGKRNTDELGGIVRIAEMSGDITKTSSWIDFLVFMALLSINLGLINLFPIPMLDGGHVVIYLIEIILRREINEQAKEYIFKFGFFLLIALMVLATYNDFARLFNRWFS